MKSLFILFHYCPASIFKELILPTLQIGGSPTHLLFYTSIILIIIWKILLLCQHLTCMNLMTCVARIIHKYHQSPAIGDIYGTTGVKVQGRRRPCTFTHLCATETFTTRCFVTSSAKHRKRKWNASGKLPIFSRTIMILFLFISTISIGFSQSDEITAEGKVTDSRTGKGIKAQIRYSSIPTGSIFGRFNDSTFSFSIFGTAKYQITAEAQGYNPRTVIVDPKDISVEKKVLRDITLTPKGETIVLNHLIFAQGKAVIDPKSYSELDEVVQMMRENSSMEIQLEGHTDNVGNAKANMELSEDRVVAVKKYIVEKGISKGRIQTKAFGGTKPLRNEMTPEARAMNRRVEMRILKD